MSILKKIYSLRPIIFFANIDVSRHIDTFILDGPARFAAPAYCLLLQHVFICTLLIHLNFVISVKWESGGQWVVCYIDMHYTGKRASTAYIHLDILWLVIGMSVVIEAWQTYSMTLVHMARVNEDYHITCGITTMRVWDRSIIHNVR
jgi:hypothetical protein